MDALPPIPTPPSQRWREFRIQMLPVITFLGITLCIVLLWRQYVLPTNIVGEVESVRVNVISSVPGTIKELKVKRFDRVREGQEIAQISTMTLELYEASLRAIEADFKLMRSRIELEIKRDTLNYQVARIDYLNKRVDLSLERINAQVYETQFGRQQTLLTNAPGLYAATEADFWRRLAETARHNVVEREKVLTDTEKTLATLSPTPPGEDVFLEAVKAQEEKLRATQMTVSIRSPIDGMISLVDHYAGEKIVPNVPILTVSAVQATRIIGFVRKPFSEIPKQGDLVTIRRQSFKREVANGIVLEVSGQLEPITPTLVPVVSGVKVELGLPFAVSFPADFALIPGEPVDLIFSKR